MKKQILLLLVLMLTSLGYSQTVPQNSRLKITKNIEDNAAQKITVKSDNDELNWITKDSLKAQLTPSLSDIFEHDNHNFNLNLGGNYFDFYQDAGDGVNRYGGYYYNLFTDNTQGFTRTSGIDGNQREYKFYTSLYTSPNTSQAMVRVGQIDNTQETDVTLSRTTSDGFTNTVSFDKPIANTTLKFPAKSAGTYTLATTDDVATAGVLANVNEGNGNGIIIKDRASANYGNVGSNAVDLSFSETTSSVFGATGLGSFSSGIENIASGYGSTALGVRTIASDSFSSSFGYQAQSTGFASHAEGSDTVASGGQAHSEGENTTASGNNSHAQNINTTASGVNSHAEGEYSTASGETSHAEGFQSRAIGKYSHAGGDNNDANSYGETSIGVFGTSPSGSATTWVGTDRLFNIGNGLDALSLSDAVTVLKNGLVTLPSVTNALIDAEPSGKALVTKEYFTANTSVPIPVSATESGIVNNTSLQELGGVDKLINNIRIGKGNGNIENNLVISRNGLANNTTGAYNVAIGNGDGANEGALQQNTTGFANTIVGSDAGLANTTGSYNTGIGAQSLFANVSGQQNTAVGSNALAANTASNNTAIGSSTLISNTTGTRNTCVGNGSGFYVTTGNDNTSIGFASTQGLVSGSRNVALGFQAGGQVKGSHNTLIGTSFNVNAGISTGNNNLLVTSGDSGLITGITTGSGNVVIGKVTGLGAADTNTITIADGGGNVALKKSTTGELTAPNLTTALVTSGGVKSLVTKEYVDNIRPYKVYTALLTQSGTTAPTAVVLENTTGATVTWDYVTTGIYTATFSSNVLISNKTAVTITDHTYGQSTAADIANINIARVYSTAGTITTPSDGILISNFFEIRIYN